MSQKQEILDQHMHRSIVRHPVNALVTPFTGRYSAEIFATRQLRLSILCCTVVYYSNWECLEFYRKYTRTIGKLNLLKNRNADAIDTYL
jgi:hypothetical protein